MDTPEADPVDLHIGRRLRAARRRRGLSQVDLAKALGVVFQQVHRYESGLNRMSASTLWRAAGTLGVDISDFFPGAAGADAPPPPPGGAILAARYATLSEGRRTLLLDIAAELAGDSGEN